MDLPRLLTLRMLPCLLLCLSLAGCSASADHPALQGVDLPALLPAHRFAYRGTVPGGYQISPDGRKPVWVAPSFGRAAMFVHNDRTGEARRYRMPSGAQWTADSRRLLYVGDTTGTTGTENAHVFMIDTKAPGSDAVDLTPYPGIRASIQQLSSAAPRHVLLLHNQRDPKLFDRFRIELKTRRQTMVGPFDWLAWAWARIF